MDLASLLDALGDESEALVALVAGADPGTPVRTCPGWSVADLAVHVGGLYHWSAGLVADGVVVEQWRSGRSTTYPERGASAATLAAWLADARGRCLEVFAAADPTAPVWAWGNDAHARFWTRRMCFETVVHRFDAACSLGEPIAIDGALAREGIDEHLENLPSTRRFGPALDALAATPGVIGVATPEGTWRVTFGHGGPFFDRGAPDGADATLSGPTDACYLALLRRVAPGESGTGLSGDKALFAAFLDALDF